jgi:nucleoid-associated protein EbfC
MMPGMPDLTQILAQAQQMQAEMERAQASLSAAEVTGSAGGGLVTAVVNGGGDLLRISIDPSVVDPADVETLEDLVIAAVHDARRAAEGLASSAMGSVTSGLDLSSMGLGGLGIPGFGGQVVVDDDNDDDFDDSDQFDDEDEDEDESDQGDTRPGFYPEVVVVEEELPPGELPPGGPPKRGGV